MHSCGRRYGWQQSLWIANLLIERTISFLTIQSEVYEQHIHYNVVQIRLHPLANHTHAAATSASGQLFADTVRRLQ